MFNRDWSSDVCSSDLGQMLTFNQTMNVDAAVIIAEESGIKIDVSMEIGRASCRERV